MRKFLFQPCVMLPACRHARTAQTYPDRPIKLLVPLAAGSAVDIVARLVADKMGEQLGQRPFVENMAGGAGVIGMRAGARAAPDGYTVIVPNDSVLTMVPNMKSDAGYDPFADFMPVTQLVGIPLGLIAHPSFPANTVAELIALAKKTPGGINYSSGGPGQPAARRHGAVRARRRHPDDPCAASRRDRSGDRDRLRAACRSASPACRR